MAQVKGIKPMFSKRFAGFLIFVFGCLTGMVSLFLLSFMASGQQPLLANWWSTCMVFSMLINPLVFIIGGILMMKKRPMRRYLEVAGIVLGSSMALWSFSYVAGSYLEGGPVPTGSLLAAIAFWAFIGVMLMATSIGFMTGKLR